MTSKEVEEVVKGSRMVRKRYKYKWEVPKLP